MRGRLVPQVLGLLLLASGLSAQGPLPMDALAPHHRAAVQDILDRLDFTFQIRTPPRKVRLATVEKLYDRPQLCAAMWRYCRFVPRFYTFEVPPTAFTVDDLKGLHGTMTLIYKRPGYRIYLADGRVERGRMKNPMAVGAKMVTAYRYHEGPHGLEGHLQTWTALDSSLLGFLSRPFRKYIQKRQEEFIAYIFSNIALGSEFVETHSQEFSEPLRREGDPVALAEFEAAFGRNRKH